LSRHAVCRHELLKRGRPDWIVFLGFGLREGQLLKLLLPAMRSQDPLISSCIPLAERTGRFLVGGGELMDWPTPLLSDETTAQHRLHLAVCVVIDIA